MDAEKISVDGFNLNISDAKARNMISDKYDPDNGTYVVGDTCINDDILYICNTDIDTPETFDSTKWDADTIGHYCTELKSNLIDLATLCSMFVDNSNTDFKVYNFTGTTYYPLSDLRNTIGTLDRNTVFIGLHSYSGTRLYVAYLYSGKNYGGCLYLTYDGSVKAQFVNNGTVSTKTFTLTSGG